jgi:hypothetical protein
VLHHKPVGQIRELEMVKHVMGGLERQQTTAEVDMEIVVEVIIVQEVEDPHSVKSAAQVILSLNAPRPKAMNVQITMTKQEMFQTLTRLTHAGL